MKIKSFLGVLFITVLFGITALAVDIQFSGPVIINPSTAIVGQSVSVRVNFFVPTGGVDNLKLIGKIDNKVVLDKFYPHLDGNKSYVKTVSWTAAHATSTPRLIGRPSNVKIEFVLDPAGTVNDTNRSNNTNIGWVKVKDGVVALNPTLKIKKPSYKKVNLGPCYTNTNAPTDLVPVEMRFRKKTSTVFSWGLKYRNDGDRCIKKFKWMLFYENHTTGMLVILKQGEVKSSKPLGWAIEGNKTGNIVGTFHVGDVPDSAYDKYIDSEVQEIDWKIKFIFKIDWDNKITETNESNNILYHTHRWTD